MIASGYRENEGITSSKLEYFGSVRRHRKKKKKNKIAKLSSGFLKSYRGKFGTAGGDYFKRNGLKAAMTRRSGDADLKIETKVQVRVSSESDADRSDAPWNDPRVVGREVLIETRVLRTRISLKFPTALATNWTRCPGLPGAMQSDVVAGYNKEFADCNFPSCSPPTPLFLPSESQPVLLHTYGIPSNSETMVHVTRLRSVRDKIVKN